MARVFGWPGGHIGLSGRHGRLVEVYARSNPVCHFLDALFACSGELLEAGVVAQKIPGRIEPE